MALSPAMSSVAASSLPPVETSALRARTVAERFFLPLVLILVILGVLRSSWATALDGFTIDEAYHIAAGATYLRLHDFRVNPEHPPLVKLIVALAEPPSVLHIDNLPHFEGKEQEREYTETAVYINSDAPTIQRRARRAMFAFHAILFVVLALLLRRLFNPGVALAALALILLDPTVAAHMPVVMTDLPMALLGAISIAAAGLVLRDGRWFDAVLLGFFAGLLVDTKHSAPLIILPIVGGCLLFLVYTILKRGAWQRRAILLALSTALAMTVIWGLYGFRYTESGTVEQQFNRPLEQKISDLESTRSRAALTLLSRFHLAPRAYIWGLADTMRAGLEGRAFELHVFGHLYESRTPPWVPLAFLVIKIPPGILALAIAGCILLISGNWPTRLPPALRWPLLGFAAAGFFFLAFVCLKGVPYAGLRHLLFVVPVLSLLAAVAVEQIFRSNSRLAYGFAAVALVAACVSALPQRRIWEYHNFLAGGSANAWRYFDNESVDLGQRTTELVAFYKSHPIGPREAHIEYWASSVVLKRAGIPLVTFDYDKPISSDVSGWFFLRATSVAPQAHYDLPALREATPVARFGNLMIFHGTFHLPGWVASAMYWRAKELTYLNPPDPVRAEDLLHRVMELEPNNYVSAIELGNFALKRQDIPDALAWYRRGLDNSPPQFRSNIREQIAKLSAASSPASVPPLHNPAQE